MSKITFSKMNNGYSPAEVDIYVDMLEAEHTKAVEMVSAQSAKIAELENKLSEITIENSRLKEDAKRFDIEISKAYEERDTLQNQLDAKEKQGEFSQKNSFETTDALIEAILSLARANEHLVSNKAKSNTALYHSPSQVDDIVNSVLSEGEFNPSKPMA